MPIVDVQNFYLSCFNVEFTYFAMAVSILEIQKKANWNKAAMKIGFVFIAGISIRKSIIALWVKAALK